MAKRGVRARMQTSLIGSFGRSRVCGFTLFELLLVLLLVGLFSTLLSLRLESLLPGGDLRLATRTMIKEIHEHRGRAAYTHSEQALGLDMDRNVLYPFVSRPDEEMKSGQPADKEQELDTAKHLPRGVTIEDVVLLSKGKIQEGEAKITFYANGCVERALIHLRNEEDEAYTLEIKPITGHVEVHDRYIEQEIK
jgi:prepilin-type N-terminal cleavage/methylation domain-containing protein